MSACALPVGSPGGCATAAQPAWRHAAISSCAASWAPSSLAASTVGISSEVPASSQSGGAAAERKRTSSSWEKETRHWAKHGGSEAAPRSPAWISANSAAPSSGMPRSAVQCPRTTAAATATSSSLRASFSRRAAAGDSRLPRACGPRAASTHESSSARSGGRCSGGSAASRSTAIDDRRKASAASASPAAPPGSESAVAAEPTARSVAESASTTKRPPSSEPADRTSAESSHRREPMRARGGGERAAERPRSESRGASRGDTGAQRASLTCRVSPACNRQGMRGWGVADKGNRRKHARAKATEPGMSRRKSRDSHGANQGNTSPGTRWTPGAAK
eukprot:scaffold2706_cov109-Isochrysis_galbana.AAC.11